MVDRLIISSFVIASPVLNQLQRITKYQLSAGRDNLPFG